MHLEDIGENARVAGLSPEGPVVVKSVGWYGDQVAMVCTQLLRALDKPEQLLQAVVQAEGGGSRVPACFSRHECVRPGFEKPPATLPLTSPLRPTAGPC